MASSDAFSLQFCLLDRFGDNGMISIVTGRHAGDTVTIDDWSMTCRVLGRRVEHATLAIVAGRRVRAVPDGSSARSGLRPGTRWSRSITRASVLLHATEDDGTTTWVLDIERVEPAAVPMAIVSA